MVDVLLNEININARPNASCEEESSFMAMMRGRGEVTAKVSMLFCQS